MEHDAVVCDPPLRPFLCYFYHTQLDFRIPELESLTTLFNHKLEYDLSSFDPEHPFLEVKLPSEEACEEITKRVVLVKGFFEVWASGSTYEEVISNLQSYPPEKMKPYLSDPSSTFKLTVDGFGKTYSSEEQRDLIQKFSFLPYEGKVSLSNPQHTFWIIEDVSYQDSTLPPRKIYFAREICTTLKKGGRSLMAKFTLKSRKYLGTTSMNSEWSLLMANQALASPGKFFFDPFVGTGSILVVSSFFEVKVIGCDIDMRVIKGNNTSKNVLTNFEQYGLKQRLVDLLGIDFAKISCLRIPPGGLFDSVITDPPYGVRAGGRKIGMKNKTKKRFLKKPRLEENAPEDAAQPQEHTQTKDVHLPQCVAYSVPELLKDLLDFAAKALVMNGRLVYWLPTTDAYQESDLPKHPCLKLLANSEHGITTRMRRRLITMEKIVAFDEKIHANLPPEAYGQGLNPAHANMRGYVFRVDEQSADVTQT